jgi:hypothetical protein
MVGEWLGVDDGWRRTKSYWWSGGFAAARQARPDAVKRRVIAKPATKLGVAMTVSRRLLALACAAVALASATVAGPALGAGNEIINDCQSHGRLTHPYTVAELRHALAVMPATVKQYTSCFDVVQGALVSARKNHGKIPVTGTNSSGSSFLPTPVIIILVVLILGAVTFGALAIRRRQAGVNAAGQVPEPRAPGEGRTRVMPSVPPHTGADETAQTQAMPSVPPEEGSDDAPTRIDEPEDDERAGKEP